MAWLLEKIEVDNKVLRKLSGEVGISEFYVTDNDGVVICSNNPETIGFAFKDDEEAQTYEFYQILKNPNLKVAQKIIKRDLDGKHFKYVGVARRDNEGIIQAGLSLEDILNFRGQYAINGVAKIS